MSEESDPVDFEVVRERELEEVVKRRREANIAPAQDDNGHHKSPSGDLVGLSLSGGGVRSASFNLGFLQALYQRGVLRHVDYMSTVSGGGYVGSSVSSLALHPDTEFEWMSRGTEGDPASKDPERPTARFPILPREDGRQPARVLELIHGGHYLRRPLIFLNRYLVGVILTNVVALSLVFAIASLAAWMFRYLDHTWTINWLFALGFQGDIARAFFPATLFFVLWLAMWGISYWRKGSQAEGRVARWFMTLTIVSVLLACAALLGTGDVSLTHLRDSYGIEQPSEFANKIGSELKTYVMIALVIALIPYLRIKDLIRSGTKPRTAVEGWVFAVASRALLYGIPLLIFGWLARENISHFNENRVVTRYGQKFNEQYDFVPLDFTDWSGTWQEIKLQATGLEEAPGAAETTETEQFDVSQTMWRVVNKEDVAESRDLLKHISSFDRQTTMLNRWLMYLGYVITGQENDVTKQFARRQEYRKKQWRVCKQLTTSVLVDSQLYKSFALDDAKLAAQMVELETRERNRRIAEIKSVSTDAELLARRIQEFDDESPKRAAEWAAEHETKPPEWSTSLKNWLRERNRVLAILDGRQPGQLGEDPAALRDQLQQMMQANAGEFANLENELKKVNWRMLQNYWGGQLSPKSTVYAMVVLDADQATRLYWFMWSLGFFLLSACTVNMNATSLHGFYRNMLSKMWVIPSPGMGRHIPLARLETVARGAPYHLIGATVHMLGRRKRKDQPTTDSFIFSQSYCGSDATGYVPTEHYMNGNFDLTNAMALSGAAVSPTQVHNPLLAVLLMLSNSRLGQWLPNPAHHVLMPRWLDRVISWLPPVPIRLLLGATQSAEQRNYCFVSDGGHHENLGLESLLRRRCRLIIASDVTGDPNYEFRDFVRLLRRMRFEFGIRIVGLNGRNSGVPLDDLTPPRLKTEYRLVDREETMASRLSKSNHAAAHYFIAKILYPADGPEGCPREGYLIFVKPNFTGDEAIDMTRYQLEDAAFPHDPTADQFYDPQKFESYRQLGFHIGRTVCFQQFESYRCHDHSLPTLGNWRPISEEEAKGDDDAARQNADNSVQTDSADGLPESTSQRHPR
jgi:hypothetical protein